MPKFDVDGSLIKKLSSLLDENNLNEIEYSQGTNHIRLVKNSGQSVVNVPVAAQTAAPAPVVQQSSPSEDKETASIDLSNAVTSPMVGTAYLAPEPGAPNYAQTGDTVTQGQVILIIEAMKVMNQIKAPKAGTLKSILIENEAPVEFGQPLFIVE